MNSAKVNAYSITLFLLIQLSTSLSTITPNQSITDGQTLVSAANTFALGFFSPGNSTFRYVGIWYYTVSEQTIVWVANRDNPINDSSGIISINANGNLVIHGSNRVVWSTNLPISSAKIHDAEIYNSGNLVLIQRDTKRVLWQSFDYPGNSYLPNMKLGLNRKTGLNRFLTSWKSPEDPGTGNWSFKFDFNGFPQLFMYKGLVRWWRVGSWTGQRWSGIQEMNPNHIFTTSIVNNQDEISVHYGIKDASFLSRLVLKESGMVHRLIWNGKVQKWIDIWAGPEEQCDNFSRCGSNSYCDPFDTGEFECKCLVGFEPKSANEWFLGDGSGGCVRKDGGAGVCGGGEGFVEVTRMKVPDTSLARVNMGLGLKECREECLRNCSCRGYAIGDESKMIGCLSWYGDMVDMRKFSDVGQDMYVRVNAKTPAEYSKKVNTRMVEILVISVAVTLILLVAVVYWLVRKKRKAQGRPSNYAFSFTSSTFLEESINRNELVDSRKNSELPFFNLSTIIEATNNFSDDNKLGQGGFGLVYKGLLRNGKEIAVKRLSKYSGQGVEEFKNEIVLIAKLQHRNLVRIIGYCIEEKEKMLIYEYLPNKSLDAFLFDETRKSVLDWRRRFDIVLGVARGILYLHQDSRLRIIHRDLKASNVLLDSSMNPKISDFGMARIFGGDVTEGNTKRVVGTYGYMSPEYAMEGQFSVKSDVYSFGVLLLEIVTGRKNSRYIEGSPSCNFVGYVWELWKDGKALDAVDPSMGDSCSTYEVSRCIEIGLLCLQEYAHDRPTMSDVIFMLANSSTLPSPKQPAFIFTRRKHGSVEQTSANEGTCSVNDVTLSTIAAR